MRPLRSASKLLTLALVISLTAPNQVTCLGPDSTVTDFQSWLQEQPPQLSPTPDPSDQAQQEVRDKIAAVRGAHQTTITLTRTGHWQSTRFVRQPQSWQVQLQQNTQDGTITGSLRVVGSPLFTEGAITGHADDTTVAGVVTNASGAQLATSPARFSPPACRGRMRPATGTWGRGAPTKTVTSDQ